MNETHWHTSESRPEVVMLGRGVIAFMLSAAQTLAAPCATPIGKAPARIGDAVAFGTNGLAVDADGAPNSYLLDGNGLSRTCDGIVGIVDGRKVQLTEPHGNAICTGAWEKARQTGDYSHVSIFGFYADPKTNVPAVQGPDDPLPGKAFVSTTSLSVPGAPETSQRHWVDATAVSYVVLTRAFAKLYDVALGDVATVYVPSSGKLAYAVFADGGPALGEASVKLHMAIGHDPIRRINGVDRAVEGFGKPVVTIVFPGAHTHPTGEADAWNREISEVGARAFDAWGGMETLKGCLP